MIPCEVGKSLDGLGDQCEVPRDTLLRQHLRETKQTWRQNRWAEKSQEDAGADELTSDVGVGVTSVLSITFSQ